MFVGRFRFSVNSVYDRKERSAESLAKAMESLAPPPKKPRLVGEFFDFVGDWKVCDFSFR